MTASFPKQCPKTLDIGNLVAEIQSLRRPGEAARLIGSADCKITHVTRLDDPKAHEGCLSFCRAAGDKLAAQLSESKTGIVFVADEMPEQPGRCWAVVEDPRGWFLDALEYYFPPRRDGSIDETARVGDGCRIADNVAIGPQAVVGDEVTIGAGTTIGPGVYIHRDTSIGENCTIQANASIGGFGVAYRREGEGDQRHFPHLGRVIIGDHVDIGAGSVVVRGILDDTVIESDTKIGNLVNIGHNCKIGESCWITSGAVVSGNVSIGPRTMVAAGASIRDYLEIGESAQIGLGSAVTRNVRDDTLVFGCPAKPLPKAFRFNS